MGATDGELDSGWHSQSSSAGDSVGGANRDLGDSSNTHGRAFGISEMTDNKTIR